MERNAATLITSISCHKGHFLVTAAIHTVGNDSVLLLVSPLYTGREMGHRVS